MSHPGSHVSVSRTDVSSRVLGAGTGRDIPALSRPVPGFSNDLGIDTVSAPTFMCTIRKKYEAHALIFLLLYIPRSQGWQ